MKTLEELRDALAGAVAFTDESAVEGFKNICLQALRAAEQRGLQTNLSYLKRISDTMEELLHAPGVDAYARSYAEVAKGIADDGIALAQGGEK